MQVVVEIVVELLDSANVIHEDDYSGIGRNDMLEEHVLQRVALLVVVHPVDVLSYILMGGAGAADREMNVSLFHESSSHFERFLGERGAEHQEASIPVLIDV